MLARHWVGCLFDYPTKWVCWVLSRGLLSPEANHYRIPLRKPLINCGMVGFDEYGQIVRLVLQYWVPTLLGAYQAQYIDNTGL